MKIRDVFYTGLAIVLLVAIVNIGHASDLKTQTFKKIEQIFEEKYKDNELNPKYKNIRVEYDGLQGMGCVFGYSINTFTILCGDACILSSLSNPYYLESALAHEIGHLYTSGETSHDSEFLADEYGLRLYKSVGGTYNQYVLRFVMRDDAESHTHPSDKARLDALKGK